MKPIVTAKFACINLISSLRETSRRRLVFRTAILLGKEIIIYKNRKM